ncbi:MAG: hypothetical protein NTY96_02610 [Bacteroidetes bacterium]|nr:hypothetical protein [Bacteroidota bacterium]
MKNYPLLSLTFACMLLVTASCKMKPQPPEAMKLPGNENSIKAYAKTENEYSEKWLNQFGSLRKKLQAELANRDYTVTAVQKVFTDTALTTGGLWKIFVNGGKDVHALSTGARNAADRIIYTETDPEFHVSLRYSYSKSYIFIESTSGQSSEVRLLPVASKSPDPVLIQERKQNVFYNADHFGGNNIWILSNENAPMRCILIAPAASPGPAKWRAAVRENDSVLIDAYAVINLQYLVLVQKKHRSTSIEITNLYPDNKGFGIENKINFPEPEGQISDLFYEQKEDKLVFRYSSIITPPSCYTYGIHTMHMGIRWKKQIKNYVQDDYKAEIIWIRTKEHGRMPVSLISKRDPERKDGTSPLVLFVESTKPWEQDDNFRPYLLSLLNRGFYIARIHVSSGVSSDSETTGLVTAAVTTLIGRRFTAPGMITIAGKGVGASMAWNAAREHPLWVRTLVLDAPAFSKPAANPLVSNIFLISGPIVTDKGLESLTLASELRKIMKPENTLLVVTGSKQIQDPEKNASLITFILESYGIKK